MNRVNRTPEEAKREARETAWDLTFGRGKAEEYDATVLQWQRVRIKLRDMFRVAGMRVYR